MEVRIGIVQTMKELEIEMPEDADRDAVIAEVEAALAKETVLWLTDRRGRRVGVPSERVAYVDVDVHHGDGVQAAFYDDPRVLTISLHESPATLFPGTGWPAETGGPAGLGSTQSGVGAARHPH